MKSLRQLVVQDPAERIHLPQELIDSVIDHLHDDKPSLAACSLVSYDWLWSARYHLFCEASVSILDVDAFSQTVSSSPVQLGSHVRVLRVRGAHDKALDNCASILQFLADVLPKLPSTRKIYLSQMVWGQTDLLALTHPQSGPRELRLLSLKDIRLEASDAQSLDIAQRHLSSLFQLFSGIESLIINTVRVGYRALYHSPTSPKAPLSRDGSSNCRISALTCFTEDDSFYILPALCRLGFSPYIQTLKFGSGCPEVTASAQVVANLAASSLRFVRYRVPSDDYVASKMPVFDLSRCEDLHTAHLRGYISNPAEARTVLSQMINTVTCTPAETQAVILEFFARPQDFHVLYQTAGRERWSLLDQQLAGRSDLRRVVIVLRSCGIPMAEKPERMLPLVHNQRKLCCVVGRVSDRIQWHMLTGL